MRRASKHFLPKIGIVDDHASSVKAIVDLLEKQGYAFELCMTANRLEEAKEKITTTQLDLLFLDVQLDDGTGFDLLPFVDKSTRVIFATAYDQFAVRAFEINALDYMMKPVEAKRLERAWEIFQSQEVRNQTLPPIRPDDEILIVESDSSSFVTAQEILFIESDKDYSIVRTPDRKHYMRRSMNKWEDLLPVSLFLRVHRSYIVNVHFLEKIRKDRSGRYELQLKHWEHPIVSSRRYSTRLKKFESFRFM